MPWIWGWSRASAAGRGCTTRFSGPTNWCWWPVRAGNTRRETVTPEELPRIPLVLRESGSGTLEVIAAALAARGIRLSQFDVTMRLGSTEGIKAFVRNSDAMAIVSVISVVDELRSGALRIVDIEGLTLSRDFVFVHAEAEPARLARRFIDFARADF